MSYEQGYAAGYEIGAAIVKALKITLYIFAPYVIYKFLRRKKMNTFKGPEA